MYPTHRTFYCDRCGRESDHQKTEVYEEDEILPGDPGERYLGLHYDFVRLREAP